MRAQIIITLKPGLLDAQGATIQRALASLGFRGVGQVRAGKYLEVDVGHRGAAAATRDVRRMCEKLLANPLVETYRIGIARGAHRRPAETGRMRRAGSRGGA